MKKYLCMILCVLLAASYTDCAAKKQKKSTVQYTNPFEGGTYDAPCTVYDDDEFFAATGIAYGSFSEKGDLIEEAQDRAQQLIIKKMKQAVTASLSSFRENTTGNHTKQLAKNVKDVIDRTIVDILNETQACCGPKFLGVDEKGNTECYMAFKVRKTELANKIADNLANTEANDIRSRAEKARSEMLGGLRNAKYDDEDESAE